MAILNTYTEETVQQNIGRLEKLAVDSQPVWGKMNAAQMLAHLNATYATSLGDIEVKNNWFMKFMLKSFVKNAVVGEKPYKRNLRTAPYFVVADKRDFEKEKGSLVNYLNKVKDLGSSHFEGKESAAFGQLSSKEWNNLFQKHLDHHLQQFNV